MPKYFFNLHRKSEVIPDLKGQDLPDRDAARAERGVTTRFGRPYFSCSSSAYSEEITSSRVPMSERITRMAVLSRSREAGLTLM
jgi:hypothetical protein